MLCYLKILVTEKYLCYDTNVYTHIVHRSTVTLFTYYTLLNKQTGLKKNIGYCQGNCTHTRHYYADRHLSTGPDYTWNVIKVYCPVDADAVVYTC